MKRSRSLLVTLTMLAATLSVQEISAQSRPQPPNSATSSQNSDIRADEKLIAACNAAAEELAASRRLSDLLETENKLLKDRLAAEQQRAELLTKISDLQGRETLALREALSARSQAVTALEKAVAIQEHTIRTLERRKRSILGRIADILLGAAVVTVIR